MDLPGKAGMAEGNPAVDWSGPFGRENADQCCPDSPALLIQASMPVRTRQWIKE